MPVSTDDKENAMRTNSHEADALQRSQNQLKKIAQEEGLKGAEEEVKLPDILGHKRNLTLNIQDTADDNL